MEELTGKGLVQKLFSEVTRKANGVLFLHPQLALCSLVHTVDEANLSFGYSHVPSLNNLVHLAAHSYGRTGRAQTVILSGEWSPSLVQAMVACIRDTVSDGPVLRWADTARGPARLQSVLYLLLLFSTLSGKYSAMALSVNLRHSMSSQTTRLSVSTLWLFPGFLTTLRDAGQLRYAFKLPIFQHIFAAPKELLTKYLPSNFMSHYDVTPDPAKWGELVQILTGVGFDSQEALHRSVEGVVSALCVVALLLDTSFQEGQPRMLSNINAMCGVFGITNIGDLFTGLRDHIDKTTCVISSALPDAIFLQVLKWAGSLMDEARTPLNIANDFPFTDPKYGTTLNSGGAHCSSHSYFPGSLAEGFSVSVAYLPQTAPDVAFTEEELPACLSPYILLCNVAAEHGNVWAAKTLLPEEGLAACKGVRLVDGLMQKTACGGTAPTRLERLMSLDTYLESTSAHNPSPSVAVAKVAKGAKTLTAQHTQGTIVYSFASLVESEVAARGVRNISRSILPACGTAHSLVEGFLLSLADFLSPLLAADALFTLHAPLYITSTSDGQPTLYNALIGKTEAAIEHTVFLRAARQLYQVAHKGHKTPEAQKAPEVPAEGPLYAEKHRKDIAHQIAQLQAELNHLDRIDDIEPPQTVSVHSTPEKGVRSPSWRAPCREKEGSTPRSVSKRTPSRSGASASASPSRPRQASVHSSVRTRSTPRTPAEKTARVDSAEVVDSTPVQRSSGRRLRTASVNNPLQGSMDQMVHLTKAFRLRQEKLKGGANPTGPRARSGSRRGGSTSSARTVSVSSAGTAQPGGTTKIRQALSQVRGENDHRVPAGQSRGFTAVPMDASPNRQLPPRTPSRTPTSGREQSVASSTPRGGGGSVPPKDPQGFTEASWKDLLSAF